MNTSITASAPAQLDGQALLLIEEHVRRLLEHMGFDNALVACRLSERSSLASADEIVIGLGIRIDAGEEGRLLIGTQGSHLLALQHLIRSLLRRQVSRDVYVSVDVNGYRARRERNLASLAESAARQAKSQGRTVVLRPMESADRRTVHAVLAARPDVKTESLGEEPNRRVVIKPIFL